MSAPAPLLPAGRQLLLTIALAVPVGLVAGVVLVGVRGDRTPEPAPAVSQQSAPDADPGSDEDSPPVAASDDPAQTDSADGVAEPEEGALLPVPSSQVGRLSHASESVRLAAAREVMLEGVSAIPRLSKMRPTTDVGRRLVASMHKALSILRRSQRHPSYKKLPESGRLELRFRALSQVLPPDLLRPERKEYWSARVELDGRKVANGDPAQLLQLSELELALVRAELEEIDHSEWRELATRDLDSVESWVDALAEDPTVPPAQVRRYREQLTRLRAGL